MIDLLVYSDELDKEISFLLSESKYIPYRYLQKSIGSELVRMWHDTISTLGNDDKDEVFVAAHDSYVIGIVGCRNSIWESGVIGHKAGEIIYLVTAEKTVDEKELLETLIESAIDWAQSQKIQYLLCKINSDNIQLANALETKGFLLVDTLLDYVYDMTRDPLEAISVPPLFSGAVLRSVVDDDIEALVAVARAAFTTHFGRFHQDHRIDNKQATSVYEEWIKASCAGYADWVVVAEVDRRIAGYSVWKKPTREENKLSKRIGHYSVGAVHPDFAGHGLFSSLTYRGMQLLSSCSDCIEGPTHINNYGVQRAYSRLSWRICDARHSFRLWLD